jgi:Arc/MetJ-type ribon-helix-helix transcriptional regulator
MADGDGDATWQVKVPKAFDEKVQKACDSLVFSTKSDFIRQAVREKLERLGLSLA